MIECFVWLERGGEGVSGGLQQKMRLTEEEGEGEEHEVRNNSHVCRECLSCGRVYKGRPSVQHSTQIRLLAPTNFPNGRY